MKKFTKVLLSSLCVVSMLGLSSCTVMDTVKGWFGGNSGNTDAGIFKGNYQTVEISAIEEFAEKITDDVYSEILLSNKGAIAKTYTKFEMKAEGLDNVSEEQTDFKISRGGLEATSSYKAEATSVIKIGDDGEKEFIYDDGTNTYCSDSDGKIKSASEGFEEVSDNIGFLESNLKLKQYVKNNSTMMNVVWEMDTSDATYVKVKLSYAPLSEEEAGDANSATVSWVYNKTTYKCIAVCANLELDMTLTLGGSEGTMKEYQEFYLIPWDGTVETPADLNTYQTAQAE